jgi:hypothetical protein
MKLIHVVFLFLLLLSCSKKDDLVPKKENIVDFKWNGKEFYHNTNPENYKLEMTGNFSDETERITITIKLLNISTSHPTPVYSIGFHVDKLEEVRQELRNATIIKWNDVCGRYVIDHDRFSNLRITNLDLENNVIEGVFAYSTYNKCDKFDTIEISFGEFSLFNLTKI